jgi:hypothetical protein
MILYQDYGSDNMDESDYRKNGSCRQCEAIKINGVYCHEHGCHVAAKEARQAAIDDGDFEPELEE